MRNFCAILIMLILAAGCKSVKKITTATSTTEQVTVKSVEVRDENRIETVQYGDTLMGIVPIDVTAITSEPVIIPVESSGISLELTVTDKKISYKAVAKPVIKTNIIEQHQSVQVDSAVVTENKVIERQTSKKSFPLSIGLALALLLIIALIVIKFIYKIKLPF